MAEFPIVDLTSARPRSCPDCRSIGVPLGGCVNPWHAEVGIAGWDDPLPVEATAGQNISGCFACACASPGHPCQRHDERPDERPDAPAWAGTGFDGRAELPVITRTTTTWVCLDCPRSGNQRDPLPPEVMAAGHGAERRHIVQLMATTLWVPEERT